MPPPRVARVAVVPKMGHELAGSSIHGAQLLGRWRDRHVQHLEPATEGLA